MAAFFWGAIGDVARGGIITFDPLTGIPTDTPYNGHTEAGFTVTTTMGNWFVAQFYGNPVPDIYAGPIGNPKTSAIQVVGNSSGTSTFNFASVDLSTNGGTSTYLVQGFLGGSLVFSEPGTDTAITQFVTIPSTDPSQVLDRLTIQITPGSGTSSVNLDNINLPSVPEPSSLTLLSLGSLALLGYGWRRRKRVVA
jgi:hypothetical protein